MATPRLAFDEMADGEQSGYVTFNDLLRILDALVQGTIKSRTTTAQPGAPADGDCYLVPTGATGADWSGQDGDLAQYYNGAWYFLTVGDWFDPWIEDEGHKRLGRKTRYLSKDVAGASNVTLTGAEADAEIIELTGALTGNIDVIWPDAEQLRAVYNNTSGAFTLTAKPSGGTGAGITQGNKELVVFDGAGSAVIWS